MSTFLVSLAAVAAATVVVLWITLGDPDQPATIGRATRRGHRSPAPARARAPSAPGGELVVAVTPPGTAASAAYGRAGVRLRSGLALLVLVAFTGVAVAAAVGAGVALAARALRHAVG